ncbi:hypothetical protein HHK36_022447 [Tetracentron sinense]|uniref:Jacalin-type lectin domain-containing protein n=1 Tax=Tetracentron sinense TaxID=13715 RepID=A0A834YPV1_TETSI|nr:hypothetical protein HHK36_022447 [Tetracentron sinense]
MEIVNLITSIIDQLWQSTARGTSYVYDLEENLNSLRSAKDDLSSLRNDVKRRIKIAEDQQMNPRDLVMGWINKVDAMEGEVDVIIQEASQLNSQRCLGGCCPKHYLSSYKVDPRPLALVEVIPIRSIVGMDWMIENVWRYITEDDQVGIIGIHGKEGLGKTALLTKINNKFHLQGTHDFDVVIWVKVSKESNVRRVQKDIAKRLGIKLEDEINDAALARLIFNALNKKKFVLLLDDIWDGVDFENVGVPRPDIKNKCKVVFTTRSEAVCRHMEAHKNLEVECLPWNEAWKLFEQTVGNETLNSHHQLSNLAVEVALKCNRAPFALINVGRTMAGNKNPHEWKRALKLLTKSASDRDKLLRGTNLTRAMVRKRWWSLDSPRQRSAKDDLSSLRNDVKRRVKIDEDQQKSPRDLVKGWINKVATMEGEVDVIIQEASQLVSQRCLGGFCSKNYPSSYKVGKKITKKLRREGNFKEVAYPRPLALAEDIPIRSPIVGMDSMLENVWRYITEEDQVRIIGIYGKEGLGKTTLLTIINHEFLCRVNHDFDVVIWVKVSKESNVRRVQKDIAKRLGLKPEDEINDAAFARLIFNALKEEEIFAAVGTSYLEEPISQGPWGGRGGGRWTHNNNGGIIQIKIVYEWGIDSIIFRTLDDGVKKYSKKFGTDGGSRTATIEIDWPNEYLTSISGTYGAHSPNHGPVIVTSLSFTTNLATHGPVGSGSGRSFSLPMEGGVIVGFHGKCGLQLDSIGVYVKPLNCLPVEDSNGIEGSHG